MPTKLLAETPNPAIESFRRALREVKEGKLFPIETLWDGIDEEGLGAGGAEAIQTRLEEVDGS